ncbi:LysE family translocator [Pseudomonas marginalis]|jgi:threonine/homoserine/homoserine lactone efflux protein|uniref:LysE family translocator n=1 Tax=Pseudomonas marginalis TaxID=298 RepID=UPI0011B80714|nr:LysE family translocator [Pseudomonas marginalis]TWR73321.1 LysE family translocator [Pseudomonas marginalis]
MDISFTTLVLFATSVAILMITPGADMIYILSNSISNGARGGMAAILGVASGAFCYVLLAIAGVAALIAASPLLYGLLVIAGAAYLSWLGVGLLRSGQSVTQVQGGIRASFWPVYRRGLMTNLFNPKAMMFTLSFMPQFIPQHASHKALSMLYLGVVLVVVMILVELPLALCGRQIGLKLGNNPRIGVWINRVAGALLLSIGVFLVLSNVF